MNLRRFSLKNQSKDDDSFMMRGQFGSGKREDRFFMNFKIQAEKMGLREEEYLEIVNLFIKTTAHNLNQLRSAIQTGDISNMLQETHSLKGAALNLGFWEICEIVERIGLKVRENSWHGISDDIELIQDRMDGIAKLLGEKPAHDESRGILGGSL